MQPAACRASPQGAPFTRARPVFLPFPAFPHPFSTFPCCFSPRLFCACPAPFFCSFHAPFCISPPFSEFLPHPFRISPTPFLRFPPHPFQHLPKFLARPFRISRIFSSRFSRAFSAFSPASFPRFPRTLAPPAARPASPFFRSCFASAQASKTVRWSRFQGGQIRSRKKSKTQGRRARAKHTRPAHAPNPRTQTVRNQLPNRLSVQYKTTRFSLTLYISLPRFSIFPPHLFSVFPRILFSIYQISCAPLPHFPHLFFALLPLFFRAFPAPFFVFFPALFLLFFRHFRILSAPFPHPFCISPAPFPRFPAPLRLPQPGPQALFSAPVLLAPKPIKPCDRAVFRGAKFAPEKRAKLKGGAPEQSTPGPPTHPIHAPKPSATNFQTGFQSNIKPRAFP